MAIPNLWRTKKQRYSLQGEVCPQCDKAIFPPRSVCPHCSRAAEGHSTSPSENAFSFALVFQLPQMAEVSAIGDD